MKKLLVCMVLAVVGVAAQAPARPKFDVASIREAPSLQQVMASHQMPHVGFTVDAGRVDIGFASLQDLICRAYDVKPYQVSGPDFLTTARFDITATFPQGAKADELPAMLQSLLADRFKLAMHRVSKTLPVYALSVGKDGAKLPPASADADAAAAAAQAKAAAAAGSQTVNTGEGGTATVTRSAGGQGATVNVSGGKNGPMQVQAGPDGMQLVADRMTMPALADMLTGLMDRPVVDATGLTGAYQVRLAVSRDDLMALARAAMAKLGMAMPPQAGGQASAPSGSSIRAGIAKLGLTLAARNAPVDTIMVDHVENTPTAN